MYPNSYSVNNISYLFNKKKMTSADKREVYWLILAAIAFLCCTLDVVFPFIMYAIKGIFYIMSGVLIIYAFKLIFQKTTK